MLANCHYRPIYFSTFWKIRTLNAGFGSQSDTLFHQEGILKSREKLEEETDGFEPCGLFNRQLLNHSVRSISIYYYYFWAKDGFRPHDLNVGNVVLFQLSYFRVQEAR